MFLRFCLWGCTSYLPAELPTTGSVTEKWHGNFGTAIFILSVTYPAHFALFMQWHGRFHQLSYQFYIHNRVAWDFVISPPMSALLTRLLQFIKNCRMKFVVLCVFYVSQCEFSISNVNKFCQTIYGINGKINL